MQPPAVHPSGGHIPAHIHKEVGGYWSKIVLNAVTCSTLAK